MAVRAWRRNRFVILYVPSIWEFYSYRDRICFLSHLLLEGGLFVPWSHLIYLCSWEQCSRKSWVPPQTYLQSSISICTFAWWNYKRIIQKLSSACNWAQGLPYTESNMSERSILGKQYEYRTRRLNGSLDHELRQTGTAHVSRSNRTRAPRN